MYIDSSTVHKSPEVENADVHQWVNRQAKWSRKEVKGILMVQWLRLHTCSAGVWV